MPELFARATDGVEVVVMDADCTQIDKGTPVWYMRGEERVSAVISENVLWDDGSSPFVMALTDAGDWVAIAASRQPDLDRPLYYIAAGYDSTHPCARQECDACKAAPAECPLRRKDTNGR
jgi:hypothetical protein